MGTGGLRRLARVRSPGFGLALLVGSFAVYATTLRTWFQGDDDEAILDVVRHPPAWSWLTEVGMGGHPRPVLWLTLWGTHRVAGTDPLWWHVGNVVLHALVAWLVGVVADRLLRGPGQERLRSLVPPLAAVLFLVSPSHAEPVSWIVGRVDLLTGAFCLLALLAWVRFRPAGASWWWALASAGCFGLALYTKEAVVSFPAVLVAYELWALPPRGERRDWARRAAAGLAPQVLLLAAYLFHFVAADESYLSGEGTLLVSSGPLSLVRRGGQLLARTVMPSMPTGAWIVVSVALLASAVGVAVGWQRWGIAEATRPHLRTFGFLATATVAMAAPVARLGVSPFLTAGGRLAYVPSAFSTIAVAMVLGLVAQLAPRVGRVVVPAVVVVAALLLVSANQTYVAGGRLMEGLNASAGRWPLDETVVVLAGPDTLGGSWAGRDAFPAALSLQHGWAFPAPYVQVSSVAMQRWDDTISVHPGSCARCVVLHLDDPGARYASPTSDQLPRAIASIGTDVLHVGERDLEVRLAEGVDLDRFWYVSGGRYVQLGSLPSS